MVHPSNAGCSGQKNKAQRPPRQRGAARPLVPTAAALAMRPHWYVLDALAENQKLEPVPSYPLPATASSLVSERSASFFFFYLAPFFFALIALPALVFCQRTHTSASTVLWLRCFTHLDALGFVDSPPILFLQRQRLRNHLLSAPVRIPLGCSPSSARLCVLSPLYSRLFSLELFLQPRSVPSSSRR